MDKKETAQLIVIGAVTTLVIIAEIVKNRTSAPISYTFPKKDNSSEKTAALTKLFETDAFKNGSSFDQQRLINAIDRLYI